MPKPHSDKDVQIALADYVRNDMTTKEIAKLRGVSASTLTVWAQNAGIPLRPRGRRTQDAPSERQRQILEMCETATYSAVAKHFGMFDQSVQRMCKRWKDYRKPKGPPFQPGEIILWKGRRLTVVAASVRTGTLTDSDERLFIQFRWVQNGRLPKKVGFDARYAVMPQKKAA